MGGTSTSWLLDLLVGSTPGFGRGGILCLVGGWLGTLLGPEGTGAGRGAGCCALWAAAAVNRFSCCPDGVRVGVGVGAGFGGGFRS
jgi:hypothetical protein